MQNPSRSHVRPRLAGAYRQFAIGILDVTGHGVQRDGECIRHLRVVNPLAMSCSTSVSRAVSRLFQCRRAACAAAPWGSTASGEQPPAMIGLMASRRAPVPQCGRPNSYPGNLEQITGRAGFDRGQHMASSPNMVITMMSVGSRRAL